MYRVILENNGLEIPIHEMGAEHDLPKLESGSIKKEINAISSFVFQMLPNNPGYLQVYPYATKVMVKKDSNAIFEGRVIIPKPSMESDGSLLKEVTCEGITAYLHDSIQPYLAEKY